MAGTGAMVSGKRKVPTLHTTTSLDRQGPRRTDEAYINGLRARDDARFLLLVDHKPVIRSNAARTEVGIRWLSGAELARTEIPTGDSWFLGVDRATGAGRFSLAMTEHRSRNAPHAIELLRPIVDLRTLAMQGAMSAEDLSLVGQAKALAHWHDGCRCCGVCGGTTLVKDGGWKRKCWACGTEHFPRTDPVVIMLVVHGDKCLLGHESRFSKEPRMYSTLAGFIEPGEDITHAVQREVFEEAGITIGDVAFHSTQPWGFPHSLMIGCVAYATTEKVNIDPAEIEEARWFTRADVRDMLAGTHPQKWWVPGQQAIAHYLIRSFADGETDR
jgi:NAD+ diphosphatase